MRCIHCSRQLVGPYCKTCDGDFSPWKAALTGALGMYLFCGVIVSWLIGHHGAGTAPGWHYVVWAVAWLPLVVVLGLGG